jgi:hypothetical protein
MKALKVWPGDKPVGRVRKFIVTVSKTAELVIDESILAQGVIEGASVSAVVEHLAFNLIGTGLVLSDVDGYANCPDASVHVAPGSCGGWDVEIDREVGLTPVPPKPRGKKRAR